MRKGSPGRGPSRPVSWCIGSANGGPLAHHDPLAPPRAGEEGRPDLAGRGLARSTSYQALHSALARLYRLDDFTMDRIGAGFFSEVYKVRHRVTGDVMVLKMNKLLSNRHNMLREVELMNRLHHPNILSYYGVCVNEGQVHALTEYINGGPLDALIVNPGVGLPWCTRVSLALDMARGMTYLHSQGVFHRDLTSKNVLIKHTQEAGEHKMVAVIADFGLAAPIPHEQCVRLRQVGSPYWMAPEVIRGDWYDHRVDVFSFGIIVCEMIARCEADPDVLPRTHTFGVHYHDFYQMCQQDCPPHFLQLAFQCCQIDPASRPSFEEVTLRLEPLLSHLVAQQTKQAQRKPKVCHRRSLSDDTFKVLRNQLGEPVCLTTAGSGPVLGPPTAPLTPQEIVERMSAADPYFQPSTSTVNPFAQLKLPARSQLALQEGGRYCHSLPDYPCPLAPPSPTGTLRPPGHHLHTSDSCLCPHPCAPCQCPTVSPETTRHCLHGASKCPAGGECRCRGPEAQPGLEAWHQALYHQPGGCVGRGEAGSSTVLQGGQLGPVRRRGSGESGFFSVDDVERVGTPELCLSYSELSTASLASTEDEEAGGPPGPVHRSSSVVTDSSEDLSSLGCCHEMGGATHCDLAPLCSGDDSMPVPPGRLHGYEHDTDIRQIVDFFERNIGAGGVGGEGPRRPSSRPRRGCLVPLLTHKFSCMHGGQRVSLALCPAHGPTPRPHPTLAKDCGAARVARSTLCGRPDRREGPRVKDRAKVYVTEGTVRQKRHIFEAK